MIFNQYLHVYNTQNKKKAQGSMENTLRKIKASSPLIASNYPESYYARQLLYWENWHALKHGMWLNNPMV